MEPTTSTTHTFYEIPNNPVGTNEIISVASQVLVAVGNSGPNPHLIDRLSEVLTITNSNESNDAINFVTRLKTALTEDAKKYHLFEPITRGISQLFTPHDFSIAQMMQILEDYFCSTQIKKSIDLLTNFSQILKKSKPQDIPLHCHKELIRLLIIPLPALKNHTERDFLMDVLASYFRLEDAAFWIETIFDPTAWHNAAHLFAQFLSKRQLESICNSNEYGSLLAEVLKRQCNATNDTTSLYAFLEQQIQISFDDSIVTFLLTATKDKMRLFQNNQDEKFHFLQSVLSRYSQMEKVLREKSYQKLRLAFVIETHHSKNNVYLSSQDHTIARSVLFLESRDIALISDANQAYPTYLRITTAVKLPVEPTATAEVVEAALYQSCKAAANLPNELADIATRLQGKPGVLQLVAKCYYKPSLDAPMRLSLFWKRPDYSLIKKDLLSKQEQIKMAFELTQGLVSMHTSGIIHNNISLGSIYFSCDKAVWAEFDHARLHDASDCTYVPYACAETAAPELWKGEKAKRYEAEMWAFGATLYMLYRGDLSWKELSKQDSDVKQESFKRKYEKKSAAIQAESDVYLSFIWQLLHPDTSKRPTCSSALEKLNTLVTQNS